MCVCHLHPHLVVIYTRGACLCRHRRAVTHALIVSTLPLFLANAATGGALLSLGASLYTVLAIVLALRIAMVVRMWTPYFAFILCGKSTSALPRCSA